MASRFRIRRRASGGAVGAPAALLASELACSEVSDTLYYGKGDDGSGNATSIVAIAGGTTLNALAGTSWAANSLAIGTGAGTVAQTTFAANTFPARGVSGGLEAKPISAQGLAIVADTYAGIKSQLGLVIGTDVQAYKANINAISDAALIGPNTFLAQSSTGTFTAKTITNNGITFVGETYAGMKTLLGLTVGTDVQAWSAKLDSLAGLTPTANYIITGAAGSAYDALLVGVNQFLARGSTGGLTQKTITDDGLTIVGDTNSSARLASLAGLTQNRNYLIAGGAGNTFTGLPFVANKFPARASTGDIEAKDITDNALTFLAASTLGNMRSAIGLGTIATQDASAVSISGGSATLSSASITSAFIDAALVPNFYQNASAPPAKTTATTLLASEIASGRHIRCTGTGASLTLPVGTDTEGQAYATNNTGWEFTIWNSGSGNYTLVTNTGWTLVDSMVVTPTQGGATFLVRRTSNSNFTLYRKQ